MFSLRDSIRRSFSKSPRHARRNTPQLKVEALETRQLLSTFALSNAGVLTQGTTVVDQNVSSFQTDGAGDLFELKTNGSLWELPSSGTWSQLDVNVGSFNVNSNGVLEEVKTNGNLWVNATPLQTAGWSKIASNVSQGGIDDLGNVYYLTSAGGFNVTNGTNPGTQINPTQDPVMNFQLGGTGNEQVYYQYGADGSPIDVDYAIFDWTDHSATDPYGIYVQGEFTQAGAGLLADGGQYSVGANGDLYIVGYATSGGSVAVTGENATTQTATVSAAAAATLFVGEAADGFTGITDGSIITSISTDVLHFKAGVTGSTADTGEFYDQEATVPGAPIPYDRVLFYAPNATTPTVGSLFQATDTTSKAPIAINNLVGTPDHEYLYFTAMSAPQAELYFDRYQIGATTPLVQLFKTATSSGTNPETFTALYDLQVGGDDSGYVLLLSATGTNSTPVVTNVTLYGAAPGATTATPINDKVLLPTSAQAEGFLGINPNLTAALAYAPYSVAPNGDVVVVETGGKLLQYNDATGSGLVIDSAGATQIGFSSNGEFFEGKSNGNFWEMTTNGTWTQLDSAGLSSFGITPYGAIYELKTNGNFWNYVGGSGTASSSSGWTKVASGVSAFTVGDGTNYNVVAGGEFDSDSEPEITYDGQVAYVSSGAGFLLLPSPYNLNGQFKATLSGSSSVFFPAYGNLLVFEYLGGIPGDTGLYV